MKKISFIIISALSALLFTSCSPKTYDINDSPIVEALEEYTDEGALLLEKSFVNEENLSYALKLLGATPMSINLNTSNGDKFDINSLKGKNSILEVKRTSCPSCKDSTPTLHEYLEELGQDIELVSIFYCDDIDTINNFYSKLGIDNKGTIISSTYDESKTFLSDYMIESVPTYIFIDDDFRISSIHIGNLDKKILEEKFNEAFFSSDKLYNNKK